MAGYPFALHRDEWIVEVIQNQSLEPIEKLCAVILIVDQTCPGTGLTLAPISLIAQKAAVSEATAELAIGRLQEEGFMREQGTVGTTGEKYYAL